MSNERIDHAAEALELVQIAYSQQDLSDLDGEPYTIAEATALAQAHAILALVEQQRIANLIALSESGRTTVNGARTALVGLYDGSAKDGSAYMALRPDIAAALGVDRG